MSISLNRIRKLFPKALKWRVRGGVKGKHHLQHIFINRPINYNPKKAIKRFSQRSTVGKCSPSLPRHKQLPPPGREPGRPESTQTALRTLGSATVFVKWCRGRGRRPVILTRWANVHVRTHALHRRRPRFPWKRRDFGKMSSSKVWRNRH